MTDRVRRQDVLVIGGGLAGMAAALAARRAGVSVTVVAEGAGVLELSSGCIDLLAVDRVGPDHPYALLGMAQVVSELSRFAVSMAELGWPLRVTVDGQMVTALGGLRRSYLLPPTVVAPAPGQRVWVGGFPALRDFHPGVAAAGLGGGAAWGWIDLPESPEAIHPVALARRLEEEGYRAEVIRRVAAALPPERPDLVLLPAVLGLTGAVAVQEAFAAALGCRVGEVIIPPPSVPGLRLAEFLRRAVLRSGIDLVMGARVVAAEVVDGATGAGGPERRVANATAPEPERRVANATAPEPERRVVSVTARGPGGERTYEASAFVLAGGGLLGNGLVAEGLTVREPVFGLPVSVPAEPGADTLAAAEFLPEGGHPFARIGVAVDRTLRPTGYQNLYLAGRMLAGYDPYAEGCGGGVAVATGRVAGRLAAGGAIR